MASRGAAAALVRTVLLRRDAASLAAGQRDFVAIPVVDIGALTQAVSSERERRAAGAASPCIFFRRSVSVLFKKIAYYYYYYYYRRDGLKACEVRMKNGMVIGWSNVGCK